VLPHVGVHGRRKHNGSLESQIESSKKVVRQTVCETRDQVRRRGSDYQNFIILGDTDVLHRTAENSLAGPVLGSPQTSDDLSAGERGKRQGLDELARGVRHYDLDRATSFAQGTGELSRLVRSDAAADAERDLHFKTFIQLRRVRLHHLAPSLRT
jgi:hypothetical protein